MPDLFEEKTNATHIGVAWDGASAGPVLAIETSCDETAVAVLAADGSVIVERVLSQFADHAPFGGVVPEIAARAHLSHLPAMAREALQAAGLRPADLAAVAATTGPGLIGGLLVGAGFGKGLALAMGRPFIAVNHLEGHALTARLPGLLPDLLPGGVAFPYLLLLLSGGHCQCVAVEGVGQYRRLGGTIDDAVGEAFDKVAKLLGHAFPRPLLGRPGCDFSFSGLKTAVAQLVATLPPGPIAPRLCADIAASFQAAVAEVLADRADHAMAMMPGATRLVVAGGVAANQTIRGALAAAAARRGLEMAAPPLRYCGDNAVMIGWAAIERLRAGLAVDGRDTRPQPRWPLDAAAHAANVTTRAKV
jgi:N6-L-threonylcarbamoyladenine synthase